MRQDPSVAEEILWQRVRGRRLNGYKFRRQKPAGAFIADFYRHECRLVVELDGETHDGRSAEDAVRTLILERDGCRVIRFRNADVIWNLGAVLEEIVRYCDERTKRTSASEAARTATPPHPCPLPGGEGVGASAADGRGASPQSAVR
jgi:very-short-patch-repair endonuclease